MAVQKILIVHGYLLQSSGSCVYVRNLAKGFIQQGYHVTIACQDMEAADVKGISKCTEDVHFADDTATITAFLPIPPHQNHLLPVYIYNPYEGYHAKVTTEMTLEEGEEHIALVSKRLAELINVHNYDFIFTNHCLFSPVNVKRALDICNKKIPYVSKIHGSALNFVAAVDERWMELIYEGLSSAKKIICGTKYMKTRLYEVLDVNKLPPVSTVACGVNTSLFSGSPRVPLKGRPLKVVYFSHILNTKGIAELLLAIPNVKEKHADIEFHVMGTGTYVDQFNAMVSAIGSNNKVSFIENARKDDFMAEHINIEKYFRTISTDFIQYHGFVTHDVLAPFLDSSDVMIAPSKHSEAFGMVTIEAMAAGVLPVVADHSGLSNVVDLISTFDPQITSCMRIKFPDEKLSIDELINSICNAVDFVKETPDIASRLQTAAVNFDWKNVCKEIMA